MKKASWAGGAEGLYYLSSQLWLYILLFYIDKKQIYRYNINRPRKKALCFMVLI